MALKEIEANDIKNAVAKLCMDVNYFVAEDILQSFKSGLEMESNSLAKEVLNDLIKNTQVAKKKQIPICQDTGMAVVFVEIGQDARIINGSIKQAINDGVAKGYNEGYLRKSVVADPIHRKNTNDNTPAIIYYEIVEGNDIKITVAPKGFGSENMSALSMLKPSDGLEGVKSFVIDTVKKADSNPCPPIIVGVGVGGTMDKAALMSKQALLKKVGERNENIFWADVEKELLFEINKLGIGPAGLGGITTALDVHINTYPTHIAGLPVAVNIGCHVTRHGEVTL